MKLANSALARAALQWRRLRPVLCAMALLLAMPTAYADPKLTVLMPEVSGKAKTIYNNILTGIKRSSKADIEVYRFDKETPPDTVLTTLRTSDVDAVISIGKGAYKIASQLEGEVPVVAGGLTLRPNGISGVSLTGEPAEFFAKAKLVAPTLKRIHLVYNQQVNGWWLAQAHESARELGLELVVHEAENVKQGAKVYRSVIKNAQAQYDAVWIPLVSIVPAKTVLPWLLKKAWSKRLIVFTNNAVHVKQGALFALYPDNVAMGAQLADLAIKEVDATNPGTTVLPLQQQRSAFNWRTASHLGLDSTLEEGKDFDRVYPLQ